MAYAPNGTLRQRHPSGTRLPLETVITYARPIAAALQYAHEKRLVHRDVKPSNMLLGSHDEILLSDFGIAVVAHNEHSLSTKETLGGTIPYMAPEQIKGKPRPASDQYALGIVVYEWLCGERPFRGPDWSIIDQHLSSSPMSLRKKNPAIPLKVEEVVLRALSKDPQDRYHNIQDFARALEEASKENEKQSTATSTTIPLDKEVLPNRPLEDEQEAINANPHLNQPEVTPEDAKHIGPINQLQIDQPGDLYSPNLTESSRIPTQQLIHDAPRSPDQKEITTANNGAKAATPLARIDNPGTIARAGSGRVAPALPRIGNGANVPPRSTPPGEGGGPANRHRNLLLLLLVTLILALLIFGGMLVFVRPGSNGNNNLFSNAFKGQAAATITITPASKSVEDTYTVIGGSTTNTQQRQVAVHAAQGAGQAPIVTVKATGHNAHPATEASGTLTFFNDVAVAQQVSSGTSFDVGDGVHIVTNASVTIPAGNGFTNGSQAVSAHAAPAGRAGNIGAFTLNVTSCCANGISVSNTAAFTGGQGAVN